MSDAVTEKGSAAPIGGPDQKDAAQKSWAVKDAAFAAAFVVLIGAVCWLAAGFRPDFSFFLTLFIDLPLQMSGLYSAVKWLLILSALGGLGFAFLSRVEDKRLVIGGAFLAALALLVFFGTGGLALAAGAGIFLGVLVSLKDMNKAAGNALLLASLLVAVATFQTLSAEDRSDAVFDRLALQMDEMMGKMGGALGDAAAAQAEALAGTIATVQEQTIDATTVRYNQYLAAQGLAVIPAAEASRVRGELVDREAIRKSLSAQPLPKMDTKALIKPLLYDKMQANLPLIGAITMFSAFGVFGSLVGPLAGLFSSILRLFEKRKS